MHKLKNAITSFAAVAALGCTAPFALADEPIQLPESAIRNDGLRIIHIHYPIVDANDEVIGVTDGSGFLLDDKHAITAAHVIRAADAGKQPLIVQVSVLPNHDYLTTAHIERVDYRRDLAILHVDTYKLSNEHHLAEQAPKICDSRPSPGSLYASGGVASTTSGSLSSIEARWAPIYAQVLEGETLPQLPVLPAEPEWNWRTGDPVMILQNAATPGDSGGAVFEEDGCFAGVTSASVWIKGNAGNLERVAIAVPVAKSDPILRGLIQAN